MNESLYAQYVAKFFPILQKYLEKINGKRTERLTYLHKTMLDMEYSPDNKWESTTLNTTYVAADYVAVDSELPIKSRDRLATANGKIPKVGISRYLKESDINAINIMIAQGATQAQIARKLSDDAQFCRVGLDEKNEKSFLEALCNGYVAIKDEDNPKMLMRLNYGYFPDNTFGATVKGEISIEDMKRVIEKADADGNTIIKICISKTTYNKLRQTKEAKELVANYKGQTFTPDSVLPTPTATVFNEAFADDNNGITFQIIDRTVMIEENGVRNSVKPWNDNRLVFICNETVGSLVYGRLAEQSNPVKNVDYQTLDTFKLISKYSLVNPLREVTSGQAFVCPVISDVDQIYVLDISEAQAVDTEKEGTDSGDEKITVWGKTYTKPQFVQELNKIAGTNFGAKDADADIIEAVNKLSNAKEAALVKAVESHVSE